ncbi:MAG: aconitase X [Acidimicrobiales bacterium]
MPLALDRRDQALLDGHHGPAAALAMRIVVRTAESMQAEQLLDITHAHIDSCLYHGRAGLDFAQRLAADGARVAVPTTLNVSSLDLLHPDLYRGDDHTRTQARALMAAYEKMGCEPTWTCAPYQLDARPGLGEHVAWAESNAIVFANSVLGARTHRYGDFLDIAAAITGRAPAAGLHLGPARHATVEFDVSSVPDDLLALDVAYPVIGHHIGKRVGTAVPVITGAPAGLSEDRLKAIGSAGASSGSLAMFHVVGSTPEAPDLETACGGRTPAERHDVTSADLRVARDQLTTTTDTRLGAISLGTPHYSVAEFARVVELLGNRRIHRDVHAYINTGRSVLNEIGLRGWTARLERAGVQIVTDTCTYITPVMADVHGTAMTDSAKWAYYAPGNLGLDVAFGSVEECIESAVRGEVVRDDRVWGDRTWSDA